MLGIGVYPEKGLFQNRTLAFKVSAWWHGYNVPVRGDSLSCGNVTGLAYWLAKMGGSV